MSIFTEGFMSEILKVAFPDDKANDVSPSASAGRNLGVGSAAGQPEKPAIQVAQTSMPPKKQIPGANSALKGPSTLV